jgi:uncharacterized protein (TIGR02271 family)
METTVIGVFDEISQAQQAKSLLRQQGIADNMLRLSSTDAGLSQPSSEEHRGFFARLFGLDESDEHLGHYSEALRRGSTLLSVHLMDDSRASEIARLLESAGAIDIDRRVELWKAGGYQGYSPNTRPLSADEVRKERDTFKVMEEKLKVGKQVVQTGGVRIHPRVLEKPVTEQVRLREERAVVERRPVDRPATPEEIATLGMQGKPIEIRETAEKAVVAKEARVVEEVRVGKEAREKTETINETLRRTDVDIQQLGEDTSDQALQDAARRRAQEGAPGRVPPPPR